MSNRKKNNANNYKYLTQPDHMVHLLVIYLSFKMQQHVIYHALHYIYGMHRHKLLNKL